MIYTEAKTGINEKGETIYILCGETKYGEYFSHRFDSKKELDAWINTGNYENIDYQIWS